MSSRNPVSRIWGRGGRASTRRDELACEERADYSSLMERRDGTRGRGRERSSAQTGRLIASTKRRRDRRSIKVASLFSRGNAALRDPQPLPFRKKVTGQSRKEERGRGRGKIEEAYSTSSRAPTVQEIACLFSLSRLISAGGYRRSGTWLQTCLKEREK